MGFLEYLKEAFDKSNSNTIKENDSGLVTDPIISYLQTAQWSSNDENIEDWDMLEFSDEAKAEAKKDVEDFINQAGSLLDGLDLAQVTHDFWLTRNGHGAGFWDGDYEEEIGEQLTDLSKKFKEIDLYQGDDGLLYFA